MHVDKDANGKELIEPLTRREREILALLDQELAAVEIAARLHLAVSSVKWNQQELYGKLGVHSRREALARARSLGLLGSLPPQPALPKHNLPSQITRFFGREAEIEHLQERLANERLVTLTGPGGVGKTRLALRVCDGVLDRYAAGVWLAELAPLADPALVAETVSIALLVREDVSRPSLEDLVAFLRERPALLVLDNCEHLLAACAHLTDALLRACPRLVVLATSREPLGIAGEAVHPVPSLPFPSPVQVLAPASLEAYAAINLFADRAALARPGFALTTHNAAAIARICQRLDGIPLAIEMAAARINLLTAEQLADRLDDAFKVLTSGSRAALPRQQTLRATIDWSYQLLTTSERRLLQRLAVFAGGCTLQAAEAVCGEVAPDEGPAAGEVLEGLAALVSKSMLIADHAAPLEARYHLQELVRQYALEKLESAGESARLRRRHLDFYIRYFEASRTGRNMSRDLTWATRLRSEQDNLRLALEWAFHDETNPEAGPRLVGILGGHWPTAQEHLEWTTRAVAFCQGREDVSPALQALVLTNASNAALINDPDTALVWKKQAVAINERIKPADDEDLMWSWCSLGRLYLDAFNDLEHALEAFEQAEASYRQRRPEHQDQPTRAHFVMHKSEVALYLGQPQAAKLHAAESLRLYREVGDDFASIEPLSCLGFACLRLHEFDEARAAFRETLRLVDEYPEAYTTNRKAYLIRCLGLADLEEGDLEQAQRQLRASAELCAEAADYNVMASCLGLLATVAARAGDRLRAARLSGAAKAMYARQKRTAIEDSTLDNLLPGWREAGDHSALAEALEAGQRLTREEAVTLGLGGESGV